jgi:hypothetical protein
MTDAERIAKLEAEVEALKKAQEPKPPFVAQPMERYDPTANATMSPGTLAGMVAAVPSGLVRSVVADRAAPVDLRAAPSAVPTKSPLRGGWAEPVPLGPPPGIELIDQQVDAADLVDRLALAKRLAGGGE